MYVYTLFIIYTLSIYIYIILFRYYIYIYIQLWGTAMWKFDM